MQNLLTPNRSNYDIWLNRAKFRFEQSEWCAEHDPMSHDFWLRHSWEALFLAAADIDAYE